MKRGVKLKLLLCFFAALFCSLLLSSSVYAADEIWNVDTDATFNTTRVVEAGNSLTVNGGGHTLTRAEGFAGSLFNVAEGASLTINNLTIDGGAPDWQEDFEAMSLYYNAAGDRSYGQFPVTLGENDIVAEAAIIESSGNVTLNGSTIQNSVATSVSPAINITGDLTITDSTILHNHSRKIRGGAITVTGNLVVDSSRFEHNVAGSQDSRQHGGAITVVSGNAIINDSEFIKNAATNGGALYVIGADLTLSNSLFQENVAGNDGTAVFLGGVQREGVATFTNNSFIRNHSLTYGQELGNGEGAISCYGSGFETISLDGDEFIENSATFDSAFGFYTDEGKEGDLKNVSVKNVKIEGNKTTKGSSVAAIERIDNAEVDGLVFNNNEGYLELYRNNNAVLKNATFNDNKGTNYGPLRVIGNRLNSSAELENVSLSNNDFNSNSYAVAVLWLENLTVNGLSIADTHPTHGSIVSVQNVNNAEITDFALTDNETDVVVFYGYDNGNITFNDLSVTGNRVGDTGYGPFVIAGSDKCDSISCSYTFNNATITNNHSNSGTGGLDLHLRSNTITIDENSVIANNTSSSQADDISIVAAKDGEPIGPITVPASAGWYIDNIDGRYRDGARQQLNSIVITDGAAYSLKAVLPSQTTNDPEPTGGDNGSDSNNTSTDNTDDSANSAPIETEPEKETITPETVKSAEKGSDDSINPSTYDDITLWYATFLASAFGLVALAALKIRRVL